MTCRISCWFPTKEKLIRRAWIWAAKLNIRQKCHRFVLEFALFCWHFCFVDSFSFLHFCFPDIFVFWLQDGRVENLKAILVVSRCVSNSTLRDNSVNLCIRLIHVYIWTNAHSSFKSFEFKFVFIWLVSKFWGKGALPLAVTERKKRTSFNRFCGNNIGERRKSCLQLQTPGKVHFEMDCCCCNHNYTFEFHLELQNGWKVVPHCVWIISLAGMGFSEEFIESSCFLSLRKWGKRARFFM